MSTLTNISVFFAGIAYEKLANENIKNIELNESLKNEKNELVRRMTVY
jgi:hypothetical protein